MVTASDDKSIKIWDAKNFKILKTLDRNVKDNAGIYTKYKYCIKYLFKGHNGRVQSVNFRKDGKKIISGGEDKIIKIWDSETFELIKSLEGS